MGPDERAREKAIEEWHEGAGEGQHLHEYLGMTWEQYKAWAEGRVPPARPLPEALWKIAYHAAINAKPCEHWKGSPEDGYRTCIGCYVDAALAALFDAENHIYWSTACLHAWMRGGPDDELHGYCACDVGLTGRKEPHTCKWCESGCICPCHEGVADG